MEEETLPVIAEAFVGPTVLPTLGVGTIDVARSSVKSLVQSEEWKVAVKGEIIGADFSEPIKAATVVQAEQLLCHLDRNNFCFRWARINFPRVVAISCWGGHVTNDLTAICTTDSLFGNNFSNFVVLDPDSSAEGCYLFRDIQRGCFVRSGKASPTLCVERVKSHSEVAKKAPKDSMENIPTSPALI